MNLALPNLEYSGGNIYNSVWIWINNAVDENTKQALEMLKLNAIDVMPASLFDGVVYFSTDFAGRRTFAWRHGDNLWISEASINRGYYTVKNIKFYE